MKGKSKNLNYCFIIFLFVVLLIGYLVIDFDWLSSPSNLTNKQINSQHKGIFPIQGN